MAEGDAYIFGYASLADPDDPDVVLARDGREVVRGVLSGFRRRWAAGMENLAARNDHAHYVDTTTGDRPDIVVVTLTIEPGEGDVNGVALPVDADSLARFDRREQRYHRIWVTDVFSVDLDRPVWAYIANELALERCADGRAAGRAFIRRSYHDQVLATFQAMGPDAWQSFNESTDPPGIPLRDLHRTQT